MRDIRELLRRVSAPDFHHTPATDKYDIHTLNGELADISCRVIHYNTVTTTMEEVKKFAVDTQPSIVVLTNHQEKGVGREEGKVWQDIPGRSILMTASYMPVRDDAIPTYSSLVALKVCQTLRKTTGNERIMVKWPNDIVYRDIANEDGDKDEVVYEDKKVAGILATHFYDDTFRRSRATLVGIGINVHYTQEELKRFITEYGTTSLDLITGTPNRRQDILRAILFDIRDLARDVEAAHVDPSFKRYDEQFRACSSLMGKKVVVTNATETIRGIVENVDIRGRLHIVGREKPIAVYDGQTKVRAA